MTSKKALFLYFLVSVPVIFSAAQTPGGTAFPSLAPDPRAQDYARMGAGGAASWRDLAEMGMWASGAGPADGPGKGKPPYRELIRAGVEELLGDPALPEDSRARGEYILMFCHKKFLKNYSLNQTRLDVLLGAGQFNCVSSAVLYSILAAAGGLETAAVVTRDHAFVTVKVEGESIDVETTNPYGFDPGNRKEFLDGFGKVTGFAYVPARNYRDRTPINTVELISLIFSNRITDFETRGRFAEAVPLAINRMVLLSGPGNTASSEFFPSGPQVALERALNFGASLAKAGKEAEALHWADMAERECPGPARWQEFRGSALNNLVVKLLKARRYAEARKALDAEGGKLRREDYSRLEALALDNELAEQARGIKTPAQADAFLEQIEGLDAGFAISPARRRELAVFGVNQKAALLAQEKGALEAIKVLEEASAKYGKDPTLETNLRSLRNSRIAELHNAFAGAYNSRRYGEALQLASAALEEYPGNRQFMKDLEMAEKALGQR